VIEHNVDTATESRKTRGRHEYSDEERLSFAVAKSCWERALEGSPSLRKAKAAAGYGSFAVRHYANAGAFHLFGALAFWVSARTLAANRGRHEHTAADALKELASRGVIEPLTKVEVANLSKHGIPIRGRGVPYRCCEPWRVKAEQKLTKSCFDKWPDERLPRHVISLHDLRQVQGLMSSDFTTPCPVIPSAKSRDITAPRPVKSLDNPPIHPEKEIQNPPPTDRSPSRTRFARAEEAAEPPPRSSFGNAQEKHGGGDELFPQYKQRLLSGSFWNPASLKRFENLDAVLRSQVKKLRRHENEYADEEILKAASRLAKDAEFEWKQSGEFAWFPTVDAVADCCDTIRRETRQKAKDATRKALQEEIEKDGQEEAERMLSRWVALMLAMDPCHRWRKLSKREIEKKLREMYGDFRERYRHAALMRATKEWRKEHDVQPTERDLEKLLTEDDYDPQYKRDLELNPGTPDPEYV